MPIYEFLCPTCKRKFRKLVGMVSNTSPLQCPKCSSTDVVRQISRFARVRSEDDSLDSLANEMDAIDDDDDPRAIRKVLREMGREMGEDFEQDFDEMMEEETSEKEDSDEETMN